MQLEVKRDDLRVTRVVDDRVGEPSDGEAVLRVEQFAVTANNVTYAVFGDAMRYWAFFPASEAGWGRVPVWGHSVVASSRAPGLAEGTKVYGYLPMGSSLVVRPERVTATGFVDASPHRAALPSVYNQYQLVQAHDRERERAILRPLFLTGFLVDDWLADEGLGGADTVLLASASSKTALATAFLLSQREDIEVVGVTSPASVAFVEKVGYYDRAVAYDDIQSLPVVPTAFVDMAGGGVTLAAVHNHLRDALTSSCLVGATHWEESAPAAELPGPAPSFFFAPDRIQKRVAEWGGDAYNERVEAAWGAFLTSVDGWLDIAERFGADELVDTWLEVVDGRTPPDVAYVVTPASR